MTTQNRNIVELARRVYALEQARLHAKRPTLNRSSIEGGALQGLDGEGNLRTVFGEQFDGTHTATVVTGPPPPKPTTPAVTPALGGLRVYWDGTFEDGALSPMDFRRVTIHAAPSAAFEGFDPTDQTKIIGSISSATGAEITAALEPGVEYVIQTFAWSQAGKFSIGSAAALGTPEGVDTSALEAELAQAKKDLEAERVARTQALADAKAELEAADRELAGMVNGIEPADMTMINEAIEKNRQAVVQAQDEVDAAEKAIADAKAETAAARAAATAARSAADAATTKAADAHNAATTAQQGADAAQSAASKAQTDATKAISDAATAKSAADAAASDAAKAAGASKVVASTTAPTDKTVLWIDTTGGANTPKVWSGSSWSVVTDAGIKAAADKAITAQSAADVAKGAADAAKAAADKAQADATKALADAAKAQADATTAITSANGKNVVTYSLAAPGTAVGKAVGDTWFQKSPGGYIIGQWEWTGAAWAAKLIDSQVIANLDVGKLTAGTATINEAVAQKLAADFGTFRVLTADKLVVGSSTNLLPNGALEWGDARNWDSRLAPGYQTTDVPPRLPAAITYKGGTISPQFLAGEVPVTAGQELLLDFWLKADKAGSRVYVEMRDQTGAHVGTASAPNNWTNLDDTLNGGVHVLVAHVPTAWTRYRRRVLVRDGVTRVKMGTFYFNHPSGAVTDATVSVAGMTLRTRAGAELIVDGSITAAHLTAGSITAEKLAALAVTAEKVAANAILAKHIKAGEIDTDHLSARAITSDKLAAGAVVAGTLAAGAINTANLFATGVITSDAISANAITADKINVDSLMAQKISSMMGEFVEIFAGKITAGMLQAEALNGMTMEGGHIYSPHRSATPRVHIGNATIETVRGYTEEDGAVNEVVGISLGGDEADKMQLLNPDGSVLAGFDADGSGRSSDFAAQGDITATGEVTADAGDFGRLAVGPYPDLADELRNRPRGVIARQQLGSSASGNGVKFGSSYLGYYELFFAPGDQLTKVTYTGQIYADGPGYYAARLVATSEPDPDVIPASPNIPRGNFTPVAFCGFQASTKGLYPIYLEGWVQPYSGSYRVLLAAAVPTGGPSGYVWSTDNEPSWMVAEGVGSYTGSADGGYNRGGGTPYTGSATVVEKAPVAVKKTYTSVWQATGVATYREGVGSMSTSQYLLQQGAYSGKGRWSHAVFNGGAVAGETGKTIAQALSGVTVSKVEFYGLMKFTYYGTGGTAVLAPATQTALTSIATSSAESRFSGWKAGTAKWVTISNALGNTVRSVAIGPDSSGLTEYVKFDPAYSNLKLRITYTR